MAEIQSFTSPRRVEISENGKYMTILTSFRYYRKDNTKPDIIVPEGFVSDGFSSGIFEFLLPRFGSGLSSAIIHDFILSTNWERSEMTRKECDEIFLEALLETKAVSKFKAYFLYYCVRFYSFLRRYD